MAKRTAYSGGNKSHTFNQIPSAEISRSAFNRSSNYKTTLDSGKLIPIFIDEILPGDTVSMSTSIFARLATPLTVTMDNIWLDFFFFFVPNRIVWDKWPFFMGEEETPGDAELPPKYGIPQVVSPAGGWTPGSIGDYLGLPTGVDITTSALPFRCVNKIWNEWFRDENLQTRLFEHKTGGIIQGDGSILPTDVAANYLLPTRQKRADYFTSALPWPQKGPAVLLGLGASAPVVPLVAHTGGSTGSSPTFSSAQILGAFPLGRETATTGFVTIQPGSTESANAPLVWADPQLQADLSAATSSTINALRQAFQVQRLLERDARGGTRLTELIKSHFGVISPDARLQRPEYLGGGTVPVNISPVAQTIPVGNGADTPLGTLAAYGTATGSGGGFSQSFTEHGHILGFVAVRADLNYQNGLHKMWTRKTRFDHYWPALAGIGEQAILNQEIYAQGTPQDTEVFGYIGRWDEYRFRPNTITGKFRSSDPQSLDIWHLAQEFTALPTLSSSFIQDTPPINRIIAVPSEPEFLLDAFFRIKHVRPMPVYGVPGMIDHF